MHTFLLICCIPTKPVCMLLGAVFFLWDFWLLKCSIFFVVGTINTKNLLKIFLIAKKAYKFLDDCLEILIFIVIFCNYRQTSYMTMCCIPYIIRSLFPYVDGVTICSQLCLLYLDFGNFEY